MKYNYNEFNKDSKLIPILLLHGWGGNLQSLYPLANELSIILSNKVVNLELPGFGSTPIMKDLMGTADYSNFVYEFLNSRNIKKCILIGHSFGGKTSINLTLKHPEIIEKLILINSSGIKPKNSIKKKIFKTFVSFIPQKIKDIAILKQIFYKKIVREYDYLEAGELKKSLDKIVGEHFDDKLHNIKIPTLIIWSQKDNAVPLWMGEFMKSKINNSKLIVVKNKTHGLPLKEPKMVSKLINDFLK